MSRTPTVAQILAVLAVVACGLMLVQKPWADILRRVLGAFALILAGLFTWRFNQSLESFQYAPGLLRVLRLSFYLGVMGGILLIVLPGARRSRPPLPLPAADTELGSGPAR